ncbi:hypothetical protein [Actinomadura sp. 9N215]|uniref:hypothetical protein n=1 Tax=Actinomadura sp. 9N215 TaxID=3375150 RepID=UPI0037BD35C2
MRTIDSGPIAGDPGGAADDLAVCRDAEDDGGSSPGTFVELGELAFGGGEADAKPFSLAVPAVLFGLGDPDGQIVADLDQAWLLSWVGP